MRDLSCGGTRVFLEVEVRRVACSRCGKGKAFRIVVSDLVRHRPIWFGVHDRSEPSLEEFFDWLGEKQATQIRLAVMDIWKRFPSASSRA